MFYDQLFQCLHFFLAVEVPCRIIGITDDDTPGTRRDELFKLSDGGQGEAVFDMGGERNDLYVGPAELERYRPRPRSVDRRAS